MQAAGPLPRAGVPGICRHSFEPPRRCGPRGLARGVKQMPSGRTLPLQGYVRCGLGGLRSGQNGQCVSQSTSPLPCQRHCMVGHVMGTGISCPSISTRLDVGWVFSCEGLSHSDNRCSRKSKPSLARAEIGIVQLPPANHVLAVWLGSSWMPGSLGAARAKRQRLRPGSENKDWTPPLIAKERVFWGSVCCMFVDMAKLCVDRVPACM